MIHRTFPNRESQSIRVLVTMIHRWGLESGEKLRADDVLTILNSCSFPHHQAGYCPYYWGDRKVIQVTSLLAL